MDPSQQSPSRPLADATSLTPAKVLHRPLGDHEAIGKDTAVLVVLAAGKGTRFGTSPKCIQPVHDKPLARHSIDSFYRALGPQAAPAVCVVGYRHEDVSAALGDDNVYILSDDPAGGTAFATHEAFCLSSLAERDPLVIITMGDRIVPPAIFRRMWQTHRAGPCEAELTFLTAIYEPPRNHGKGRIVRDAGGSVVQIVEQRDIDAEGDELTRNALDNLTEGNCPLYVIRAAKLKRYLQPLRNDNAQRQYYLTDIIRAIAADGGEVRTVTTSPTEPEYDLLCSDVTQARDLAMLEGIMAQAEALLAPEDLEVRRAAAALAADRPKAQSLAMARQIEQLAALAAREDLPFEGNRPVGLGVSGGRLRIAFMHPDMERFFGPAWQMPIGAGEPEDDEQIVLLTQQGDDERIHLFPADPQYREKVNSILDDEGMYPGREVSSLHAYEEFGTRMSETLLLSLGYFSDEELQRRRLAGLPLPPPSLWVSSNMRRPFTLIANALASLRTLGGNLGQRVQESLGRSHFRGLRVTLTGDIPRGGFSSSSAVTVAMKNAINALLDLGIPADLLVHLACQAEYGTGVRAGSLDQATEQKGRAGQGTLISSNPRDNYRILGTYRVPTDRISIIFPYSVERDRSAWRWSWGFYGRAAGEGEPLTAGEMRKLTGKAAAIAAVLAELPVDSDFFKLIEDDLLDDGLLSLKSRRSIASILLQLPLRIDRDELRREVFSHRDWYAGQLRDSAAAGDSIEADAAMESLFAGWRQPQLRYVANDGRIVTQPGVPLRAIVAYLFGEVAKNFYLIHHPEQWVACVARSQRGDCCFEIDPSALPSRRELETPLAWEAQSGLHPSEDDGAGAELLDMWLERYDARPFDFNRGLDDATLAAADPPQFHELAGSNFFRGLALVDLAEAMLQRAFGAENVAVRVNAAGQGDYFQVHIDRDHVDPREVKDFVRVAVFRRFGLSPSPEFVELHPGGGAAGLRLSRFDSLGALASALREQAGR